MGVATMREQAKQQSPKQATAATFLIQETFRIESDAQQLRNSVRGLREFLCFEHLASLKKHVQSVEDYMHEELFPCGFDPISMGM